MSTLTPSASSVSSLNPSSSSRFMLRIPLLGRPKMSLDQAVAQAAADDIRTSKSEDSIAEVSKSPATLPGSPVPAVIVSLPSAPDLAAEAEADVLNHVASPTSSAEASSAATPAPSDPPSTEEVTIDGSMPDQPAPSSSSWFSYLRWSESSTVVNTSTSDPKMDGNPDSSKTDEPPVELPSSEPAQSDPAPSAASDDSVRRRTTSDTPAAPLAQTPAGPASPSKRHSSEVSRAEIKEIIDGGEKRQTPSLFSAETAKSQGSAWYSPWAWYAASPVVPSSSSLANQASSSEDTLRGKNKGDGGEGGGEGEEGGGQPAHQKTESEMVKEEALAREEAKEEAKAAEAAEAAVQPKEDSPHPEASSPLGNPIESSMSTHREGWMSFFMSRAMLMKSITNEEEGKRDENGMEVMDIEDGDEPDEGKAVEVKVEATESTVDEPAKEAKGSKDSKETKVAKDPKDPKRSAPQAITIVAGKKLKPNPTSPTTTSSVPSSKSPPAPPAPKEREPKKSGPPAPPLTDSEQIKKDTARGRDTRSPSPAPSKASANGPRSAPPNLVLPTWQDTFHTPPRSHVPPPPTPPATQRGALGKTLQVLSDVLLGGGDAHGSVRSRKGKARAREDPGAYALHGAELPKALDVLGTPFDPAALDGSCRVVVIGVAGWSPGALTRTLAGGLPSSSSKFVNMTCAALEQFEEAHGFRFQKITKMPLEGDGTIERKVAKVHEHLLSNDEWKEDLHAADVIFVATHSQGSVVSTHLIAQLLNEGHILTQKNMDIITRTAATVAPGGVSPSQPARAKAQRICCLALCGIHLGPLRYLRTSSLLQPYIQYFENAAAHELFDFQNTESEVSRSYVKALNTVMDHGTKMVYVASLNDQVVPIYSGIFASAAHPRILRALYIDGDAYSSSDFLSNLLVLLIRIRNSGLSDSGLLTHLSEATAGTLSGVGHSTAYEEPAVYSLAVDYAFLTTDGGEPDSTLAVEAFNAVDEQNDYEIPWSLRDLIADERVAHFFAKEFAQLRDAFDDWAPKTSILRDVKRKLQPIQRLSSIKGSAFGSRL
ncbi:hypothetical protein PsYK624_123540 [Phanerochaete sordida]|uniref:YMC020W-like alpha/beta hydrolase domain-containing protein n=1 Tax=Phanerochaete sordida TaxID=48140 RepID=A0A9P3LI41_9APHY|nr:hypothetical protein PsYK624_123540 [Phanerochaete sordida]